MRLARLKTRRDFLRVAETRRRYVTPGLILQVRRHDDEEAEVLPPVRVGFTVSRKVGNAVARNRVRRRLRAVADAVMPNGAEPRRDYVLVGRRDTKARAFRALIGDLETALGRLGALRSGGMPAKRMATA